MTAQINTPVVNNRPYKRAGVIGLILLVAAVMIGVVAALAGSPVAPASAEGPGDTPGSSAPATSFDPSFLTVKSAEFDCIAAVEAAYGAAAVDKANGLVDFDIGVQKGVPPRVNSDDISTPIVATDGEAARDEVQLAICLDPVLGYSTANVLANLVVAGYNVGDLNSDWLKPYQGDPNQIQGWVEKIVMYDDVQYTPEQIQEHVVAAQQYVVFVNKLNTLLDRFKVIGIEARTSVLNLHVVAGNLVVGRIPAIEANPNQDSLPALVLAVTEKDVCAELSAIGFNMEDKRPEVFAAKTCEAPAEAPAPAAPAEQPAPGAPEAPAPGSPEAPAPGTPEQPAPGTTEQPPPGTTQQPPPVTTEVPSTTAPPTTSGDKFASETPQHPIAPIVHPPAGSVIDRTGGTIASPTPPPAPPAQPGQPAGPGAISTTSDPAPPSATATATGLPPTNTSVYVPE